MAYLPIFFSNTVDTFIIITQLNRRFSYVPDLIQEVNAMRWNVWIN